MIWRFMALLACGVLLSGCYESQDLLLDKDAALQPLRAGVHTLIAEDGTVTRLSLSLDPDGWYEVQEIKDGGGDGPHKVLVNALDEDGTRSLYAYATYDGHESAYVYGVIAVNADGGVERKASDCRRAADAKIAADSGADRLTDSCQFNRNDKALLNALKALAKNPKHWDKLD